MNDQPRKRIKPRYTDKREIMADIYETERKINKLTIQAQALDDLASQKRKMMNQEFYKNDVQTLQVMADIHNTEADKIKITIRNQRLRLHNLGEKLAEFQTMTLPGLLPDETVECL